MITLNKTGKSMKKIVFMALAFAAVLSCTKTKSESDELYQDVRVNISVEGPETKALKTGWENGDVINIWFVGHASATPDMTITYDGSDWNPSKVLTSVLDALPASGGKLVAIWEGYNDLAGSYNAKVDGEGFAKFYSKNADKMVLCWMPIAFTYDSATKTITATLSSQRSRRSAQITVPGITAGDWTLNCPVLAKANYFAVREGETSIVYQSSFSSDSPASGYSAADGYVFVFGEIANAARTAGSAEFVFTLSDGTNSYEYNAGTKPIVYSSGNTGAFPFMAVKLPTFDGEGVQTYWKKQ